MTLDLDAIRARDAAMPFNDPQSEWDSHARAARDRRDLLAEVDRLREEVLSLQSAWRDSDYAEQEGRDAERARALPVIEAARALLDGMWERDQSQRRAALALLLLAALALVAGLEEE